SADTAILARRAVLFTWKVPSARSGQDLQQALSSQAKGTFYVYGAAPQLFRRKAEASLDDDVRVTEEAGAACRQRLGEWMSSSRRAMFSRQRSRNSMPRMSLPFRLVRG